MATIDGRKLDHKALEHIRIQAVRRVLEDGERPSEVMKSYGFFRTPPHPPPPEIHDEGWEGVAGGGASWGLEARRRRSPARCWKAWPPSAATSVRMLAGLITL